VRTKYTLQDTWKIICITNFLNGIYHLIYLCIIAIPSPDPVEQKQQVYSVRNMTSSISKLEHLGFVNLFRLIMDIFSLAWR
jgi:hypothetical protein